MKKENSEVDDSSEEGLSNILNWRLWYEEWLKRQSCKK